MDGVLATTLALGALGVGVGIGLAVGLLSTRLLRRHLLDEESREDEEP